MLGKHGNLAIELRVVPRRAVPDIGFLRDQAQHLLLAGAPDDDRRPRRLDGARPTEAAAQTVIAPVEVRTLTGPERLDHLERFAELLDPDAGRRKIESVGGVLGLVPTRADGQLEPAAADHVERRAHLREQRGRTKRVAEHVRADAHAARERGARGHGRPGLEDVAGRVRDRQQMVDEVDCVKAEVVGDPAGVRDAGPAVVRLAKERAEADGASAGQAHPIRPRRNAPILSTADCASSSHGGNQCQTWIIESQTSIVASTPAARARSASRVASSSSTSSLPTWISIGGSPRRSAKSGDASGVRGSVAPRYSFAMTVMPGRMTRGSLAALVS